MMKSSALEQNWLDALRDLESRQKNHQEKHQIALTEKMKQIDLRTREMLKQTVQLAEKDFQGSLRDLQERFQREREDRRQYWKDQLRAAEKESVETEVKSILSSLLEEVPPHD